MPLPARSTAPADTKAAFPLPALLPFQVLLDSNGDKFIDIRKLQPS